MKNILKIFKADLMALVKNFFVLVIAGGLALLPALYAWFNIYANWNPYGSTGNIAIAVVNLDQGYTTEEGEYKNMGKNIVEELAGKDTIGWVFLDTENQAKSGVESGDYYAALVIDEAFSSSMYEGISDTISNPKLTYYVNDKKNAVATKITDTAVSTVQNSINEEYVKVVAETLFSNTNDLASQIEEGDGVASVTLSLETVRDSLDSYDQMIDTFMDANLDVISATSTTSKDLDASQEDIAAGIEKLEGSRDKLSKAQTTFESYNKDVTDTMDQVKKSLKNISKEISDTKLKSDVKTLESDTTKIIEDIATLSQELTELTAKLEELKNSDADNAQVAAVLSSISTIRNMLSGLNTSLAVTSAENSASKITSSLKTTLTTYETTVQQIQNMYTNQIVPQVSDLLEQMSETLKSVESLLNSLSKTAAGMSQVFTDAGDTLSTMNLSLEELKGIIEASSQSLDDVLDKLEGESEAQQIDTLLTFLGGDPELMGSFFSQPVQMKEEYIYEIENYGSGVAPFYTTLAIWVGMTILVSMVKVHAKYDDLQDVKPYQLFFGRYLTFFLLSQIQALIIVLGDLYLLGIQCLYPFAFWAAAAMASLTFSLLVYALTIAFGDIGKAAAVVIMVIQIAGSGGTYPIEALPTFFRAVYYFFPFPHAINAMRECIGGMYENNYYVYLSYLLIFCVAALVIGLVIRIPFIGFNHYIEERMEDTEMM